MKIPYLALLIPCIFFAEHSLAIDGCTFVPWTRDYVNSDTELRNVYFGEQHIHTIKSPDAFSAETRMTPAQTFQYAMGCEVTVPYSADYEDGQPAPIRKNKSYDWVAITDHAEYLGVLNDGGESPDILEVINSITEGVPDPDYTVDTIRDRWVEQVREIERYNQPDIFTTLIAFEWTSIPNYQNLHRNVFFRGAPVEVCSVQSGDDGTGDIPCYQSIAPSAPFSTFDSTDPEDLWTYLEIQRMAGYDNFAIPHNGNVSDGLLYSNKRHNGLPFDEKYVQRRFNNEPLTEIIQAKGQSDTHPLLSPNDEFADFELFPNLIGTSFVSQIHGGYIRQALAQGLEHEKKLGVNPFKFGIVSGSDSHSGFSGNEENNYKGTHGSVDDTVEKRLTDHEQDAPSLFGSPGATGVWATANTREEIFAAMQRKETYGTSGPLIQLRFFGGWDYSEAELFGRDSEPSGLGSSAATFDHEAFIKTADSTGEPMGGDLRPIPPAGEIGVNGYLVNGPTFAVWALKDSDSGDLDRIQIIKVWTENGRSREKIIDVDWAWVDGREKDTNGEIPPLQIEIDPDDPMYVDGVGAEELYGVWQDDNFNPEQRVAYYVRVLEIKTPRWTTWDFDSAENTNADTPLPIPEGVPVSIQERAWSSPIWYTPILLLVDPLYPIKSNEQKRKKAKKS